MSDTPKVEVYTKWGCPYCARAKQLLDSKGVSYEEFDVTMGGPKKAESIVTPASGPVQGPDARLLRLRASRAFAAGFSDPHLRRQRQGPERERR